MESEKIINAVNVEFSTDVELTTLSQLQKTQNQNHNEVSHKLIGIAEMNLYIAKQNESLLKDNKELSQELEKLNGELNFLKKEREEKQKRKSLYLKRKRLPKRDAMTASIYLKLIEYACKPTYKEVRLRIAFCILMVTGIRINELLSLKVFQMKTLLESHWIGIDRSKRGPANHKAFLTNEGKKIIQNRLKDFQFIFLMKEQNSYIFTSEHNHTKMLRRETITKQVNEILRSVSEDLLEKPNITSHSFRVGYITQLWRDTNDIEFVRQAIGHTKIETTSNYVKKLSDQDRQERMNKIDTVTLNKN